MGVFVAIMLMVNAPQLFTLQWALIACCTLPANKLKASSSLYSKEATNCSITASSVGVVRRPWSVYVSQWAWPTVVRGPVHGPCFRQTPNELVIQSAYTTRFHSVFDLYYTQLGLAKRLEHQWPDNGGVGSSPERALLFFSSFFSFSKIIILPQARKSVGYATI